MPNNIPTVHISDIPCCTIQLKVLIFQLLLPFCTKKLKFEIIVLPWKHLT